MSNLPTRPVLTTRDILGLFLPLAATSTMMSVSTPIINAGLARMPDPELNLAVFGIAFTLSVFLESPVFALQQAHPRQLEIAHAGLDQAFENHRQILLPARLFDMAQQGSDALQIMLHLDMRLAQIVAILPRLVFQILGLRLEQAQIGGAVDPQPASDEAEIPRLWFLRSLLAQLRLIRPTQSTPSTAVLSGDLAAARTWWAKPLAEPAAL